MLIPLVDRKELPPQSIESVATRIFNVFCFEESVHLSEQKVAMSLSRNLLCLLVVVVTFLNATVQAEDIADQVDEKLLAKLQGVWDPVSSIFDGNENELGATKKPSLLIEGRKMSIRFQDQIVGSLEIKHLITNKSLGHIDYEMKDPLGETVRAKQVFKLEGDKLTTCVRSPPGDRPTELTSVPGSKQLLTVSKRRK